MTEKKMIDMITERANNLKKEKVVQEKMMSFKDNDEAYEFLIKLSISTLMGK